MKHWFLAALTAFALASLSTASLSQSYLPFFAQYGYVPTPGQWMQAWQAKQDVLGYPPLNKNGDTMLGELTFNAHILSASTVPTVSSCGTGSPSVAGSDNFGKITAGGGTLTSCVVDFGNAWGTAPSCVVSSTTALSSVTVTASTTQLTVGATSLTSAVVTYTCGSVSELEPVNDNFAKVKNSA